MKNKIPLWINLSFWFFLCAGMIFDMLVVAVNWRSGELTDIKHLQDFFRITNPGDYFYLKFGVLIFSIICLVYYWKPSKAIRMLLLIALGVSLADMVFTIVHFLPINIYLGGSDLDPVLTRQRANSWFTANYFRIALDFVGLYVSARALHKQYTLLPKQ
ncbi:MAG: hypothetical protein WBP41_21000 [Saprospiraceae bacterium]